MEGKFNVFALNAWIDIRIKLNHSIDFLQYTD